jgi:flagellar M-ring protein FliF
MKAMQAPKPVTVLVGGPGGGAGGAGGALGAAGGAGQLDALVADDAQRPALAGPDGAAVTLTPTDHQLRLEAARKLALENPMAVANIVKDWINGEDGGAA